MNSQVNKHGLGRHIPIPAKRLIRQKCGFGCVICGCAIYEYEHVDPPFEGAHEHDPNKITLLCGSCHRYVTKGIWSKKKVRKAMGSPKCLEQGFSFGAFDIGNSSPIVALGTVTWVDTPIIVEALGEPLLRTEVPEDVGCPFRLSGTFCDREGQEIFRIDQNEWQGSIENWDIEVQGTRITVRRASREIALQIRTDPPNKLIIEHIDMFYKGFRIIGEEGKDIRVISRHGSTIQAFSPSVTKKIIESGGGFSEESRQKMLTRYNVGDLPGVTLTGCEAGFILHEDGQVSWGRGCSKVNPGGGSMLITF